MESGCNCQDLVLVKLRVAAQLLGRLGCRCSFLALDVSSSTSLRRQLGRSTPDFPDKRHVGMSWWQLLTGFASCNSRGSAGEAEEEGYEDEYQLEDIDIGAANYINATPLGNWRHMWEETNPDSEMGDDYGLGVRDSLQVHSSLHLPHLHHPRHNRLSGKRCLQGSHCLLPAALCQAQGGERTAGGGVVTLAVGSSTAVCQMGMP